MIPERREMNEAYPVKNSVLLSRESFEAPGMEETYSGFPVMKR